MQIGSLPVQFLAHFIHGSPGHLHLPLGAQLQRQREQIFRIHLCDPAERDQRRQRSRDLLLPPEEAQNPCWRRNWFLDDVYDKLVLTGMKVSGFWVGVAEKVAPVLKPLLDKFASLDLASWGTEGR